MHLHSIVLGNETPYVIEFNCIGNTIGEEDPEGEGATKKTGR